jgi:hypothetical protein
VGGEEVLGEERVVLGPDGGAVVGAIDHALGDASDAGDLLGDWDAGVD